MNKRTAFFATIGLIASVVVAQAEQITVTSWEEPIKMGNVKPILNPLRTRQASRLSRKPIQENWQNKGAGRHE